MAMHQLWRRCVAATLLLALAAAAQPANAQNFSMNFAQLDLLEGTLSLGGPSDAPTYCPFTSTVKKGADGAGCGGSFSVFWSNETDYFFMEGLPKVELLHNNNAFCYECCADAAGFSYGDGDLWLTFPAPAFVEGDDTTFISYNAKLTMDEESGAVALTGYRFTKAGVGTPVCSAMYTLSEDDGLASLLRWSDVMIQYP